MGEEGALGIGEMGDDEVGNGDMGNGGVGNGYVGNGDVGNGHVDPNRMNWVNCHTSDLVLLTNYSEDADRLAFQASFFDDPHFCVYHLHHKTYLGVFVYL